MRRQLLYSSCLGMIILLTHCSKGEPDNNQRNNNTPPVITSIAPTRGMAGIKDTINGRDFSPLAAENKVMFNGVPASVISASATQLIVTVPQSGATGAVTVTVDGKTATGPIFTYQTAPDDSVMVTTYAGTVFGSEDGPASTAKLGYLWDISFDKDGSLWVADGSPNKVRKIANGTISSLHGTNMPNYPYFNPYLIVSVRPGPNNLLYITDLTTHMIRTLNSSGLSNDYIGQTGSYWDSTGAYSALNRPGPMVFDKTGNMFVLDQGANRVRKISPAGVVTTFAGNARGVGGWVDGIGTAAYFNSPRGITIDKDDNLYVADYGNNKIRKITPAGVVSTIAGNSQGNHQDGYGLSAGIGLPMGIVFDDRTGNLYVTTHSANRIRKIRPDGYVSTVAGTGAEGATDGPGRIATFKGPVALALDSSGNLYVADGENCKIRKITFK